MEINVKLTEYVKTEGVPMRITLPDEKTYYFQTRIRRSIAVIPRWTSWNTERGLPETVFEYEIICLYQSFDCKIEKVSIQVSRIGDIYSSKSGSYYELLLFLMRADEYDKRTEERFLADYAAILDTLKRTMET